MHAGRAELPAREFLTALVRRLRGRHPRRHRPAPQRRPTTTPPGAWNALACAAVGARLLGSTRDATRHALGIAEYHGPRSQMMRCIDSSDHGEGRLGLGRAGRASRAAYLAQERLHRRARDLDRGRAMRRSLERSRRSAGASSSSISSPTRSAAGRSPPWRRPPRSSERTRFGADAIEAVEVESFAEAVRLGCARPATTEEAQYALGFPLAAFLVRGRLGVGRDQRRRPARPRDPAMLGAHRLREDPASRRRFRSSASPACPSPSRTAPATGAP